MAKTRLTLTSKYLSIKTTILMDTFKAKALMAHENPMECVIDDINLFYVAGFKNSRFYKPTAKLRYLTPYQANKLHIYLTESHDVWNTIEIPNEEKTYRIVGKTNGWIASRDIDFNGKTNITIEEGLTLKEAQEKLMDMFNSDYETYYKNWGLVRSHHPYEANTYQDGTRSYEYDSRAYCIEEENNALDEKEN